MALICAPPTQEALRSLRMALFARCCPGQKTTQRSAQISKLDALREALSPAPPESAAAGEWRSEVDLKLERITAILEGRGELEPEDEEAEDGLTTAAGARSGGKLPKGKFGLRQKKAANGASGDKVLPNETKVEELDP